MFGLHLVFFNYVDFETSPFYITFRRVYDGSNSQLYHFNEKDAKQIYYFIKKIVELL